MTQLLWNWVVCCSVHWKITWYVQNVLNNKKTDLPSMVKQRFQMFPLSSSSWCASMSTLFLTFKSWPWFSGYNFTQFHRVSEFKSIERVWNGPTCTTPAGTGLLSLGWWAGLRAAVLSSILQVTSDCILFSSPPNGLPFWHICPVFIQRGRGGDVVPAARLLSSISSSFSDGCLSLWERCVRQFIAEWGGKQDEIWRDY